VRAPWWIGARPATPIRYEALLHCSGNMVEQSLSYKQSELSPSLHTQALIGQV
jgi:hypothetical protein